MKKLHSAVIALALDLVVASPSRAAEATSYPLAVVPNEVTTVPDLNAGGYYTLMPDRTAGQHVYAGTVTATSEAYIFQGQSAIDVYLAGEISARCTEFSDVPDLGRQVDIGGSRQPAPTFSLRVTGGQGAGISYPILAAQHTPAVVPEIKLTIRLNYPYGDIFPGYGSSARVFLNPTLDSLFGPDGGGLKSGPGGDKVHDNFRRFYYKTLVGWLEVGHEAGTAGTVHTRGSEPLSSTGVLVELSAAGGNRLLYSHGRIHPTMLTVLVADEYQNPPMASSTWCSLWPASSALVDLEGIGFNSFTPLQFHDGAPIQGSWDYGFDYIALGTDAGHFSAHHRCEVLDGALGEWVGWMNYGDPNLADSASTIVHPGRGHYIVSQTLTPLILYQSLPSSYSSE